MKRFMKNRAITIFLITLSSGFVMGLTVLPDIANSLIIVKSLKLSPSGANNQPSTIELDGGNGSITAQAIKILSGAFNINLGALSNKSVLGEDIADEAITIEKIKDDILTTGQPCLLGTKTIPHLGKIVAYKTNSSDSQNKCEQEIRNCLDGQLDGSFEFTTCAVAETLRCGKNDPNTSCFRN